MSKSELDKVVVSPQIEMEMAEVEAYWTAEAKAAAEPVPLPTVTALPGVEAAVMVPEEAILEDALGPDGPEAVVEMRPCFVTTRVANLKAFPYCAVGKLFMAFGDKNYVGSAWVVGESTICTAGHCVHDKALGWASRLLFEPQYDDKLTVGSWVIPSSKVAAPKAWTDKEDHSRDIAFCIASRPIRPTTGRLGWMANYPPNQGPYTQIGYPAQSIPNYPFDGQHMWACVGDFVSVQDATDGAKIIKVCSNMTGGCSGGPWVVLRENSWRGNGLNSFRWTNEPTNMCSPYFGQAFLNLIDWMRKNGGDK